ncbi:hypothetical protein BO85DRAFT_265240 [Aspergillus piperis CBS 112811]|uniref:Uncharacterized protein n=1 Tax=Aspergillus piperis CBS 112811 TaxID=1448313 RepID=A0A8G1R655_9EURO|nr:hypothetical protein BO85DRAFT_265240 [Aspergillus piperis CBS 112811]RAH59202.1 hypothetical protein BO85DRAFT_265240 [Aspergillus piperis CBS 112811]
MHAGTTAKHTYSAFLFGRGPGRTLLYVSSILYYLRMYLVLSYNDHTVASYQQFLISFSFQQADESLKRMQPSCAVRVVSGCSSHARCSKGGQVCIIEK